MIKFYPGDASDLKKTAQQIAESGMQAVSVYADARQASELIYHLIACGGYAASRQECETLLSSAHTAKPLSAVLTGIGAKSVMQHKFILCRVTEAQAKSLPQQCGGKVVFIIQTAQNAIERRKEMNIEQDKIQAIVQQVLSELGGNTAAAPKAAGAVPATSKAAMLTKLEHYDIKEFPIPQLGDDDILVKVEGCGICGTDAHEFKRDPFGLIPVVLGHEGTGEIVKMGKNVTKDSAGKALNIGDKVVTCMIFKDNPDITMFD